jgi:hypothetical protein
MGEGRGEGEPRFPLTFALLDKSAAGLDGQNEFVLNKSIGVWQDNKNSVNN